MNEFAQFEHDGWERVANKYDSVWSSSTRQFIPPLLDAANVSSGMSVLDIGCGPGYVAVAAAERGAKASGVDFSRQMITIATRMFPHIHFHEGDAQNLNFPDQTFERVLANFALLHVADPERVCSEACRVLKPGGKFAFTIWAPPAESAYAKIIDEALAAHADMAVQLPTGPPHYLFADKEDFRCALVRAGFDGDSMAFKLHMIEWYVPTVRFVYDAERHAGVRTAGLLARQTRDRLEAIRSAIEQGVERYARGNEFAIPKGAYIIAMTKPGSISAHKEDG